MAQIASVSLHLEVRVSSACPFLLSQSFLKELPGSLLVSNLYDSWVSALDNEDPRQRDQEVRK